MTTENLNPEGTELAPETPNPQTPDTPPEPIDTPDPDTGAPEIPTQVDERSRLTPEKIASKSRSRKAQDDPNNPVIETPEPTETPPPAFTPNFKFNVMDKEYEIPEKFRDLIKDAESEKEVKEIFTKVHGLDFQKPKYEQLKVKHAEVEQNFSDVLGAVQDLRSVYQQAVGSGNLLLLDDFFDRLKIPSDVVLQYALAKVQYGELDPEARKVLDQQVSAQKRLMDLERQNQGFSEQAMSAATQAKGALLDSCLARPDIQAIAQVFDSSPGRKPGDFRKTVCEHGEYVWYKSNGQMDLSPDEAIQQVMQRFGVTVPQPGGQPAPTLPANPPAVPPQGNANPTTTRPAPVIPNVTSRSASPMKPRPKSIADLRKLSQAANR